MDAKFRFNGQESAEADDALWELLNVFADGEANAEETAQVEAWLAADPALAANLSFLRQTSSVMHDAPEMEPPAFLRQAIYAKTIHRPTVKSRLTAAWTYWRVGIVRYALPTGAAAVAGLLAFVVWNRPNTPQRTASAAVSQEPHQTIVRVSPPSAPGQSKAAKPMVPPVAGETKKPFSPVGVAMATPKIRTENNDLARLLTLAAAKSSDTPKPITTGLVLKKPTIKVSVKQNAPKSAMPAMQSAKNEQTPKSPDYSLRPNMDVPNQQPVTAETITIARTNDGDTPRTEAADSRPDNSATDSDSEDGVRRMAGHLLTTSLEAHQLPTVSMLRQQRRARNSGYNDLTVDSIRRNQTTVAFVGRF